MVPLAIQPSRGEIWGSLLKPPCLSSSMSNQTLTSFTHFLTIFLAPFPFPTIATTFIQVFIVSHSCQHKNHLLLPLSLLPHPSHALDSSRVSVKDISNLLLWHTSGSHGILRCSTIKYCAYELEIILLAENTTNLSVYSFKDCIYLNDFLLLNFSTTLNLHPFYCYWYLLAGIKGLQKFYRLKFNSWTNNLIFSLNWEKARTALFWEGKPVLRGMRVQVLLSSNVNLVMLLFRWKIVNSSLGSKA